MDPHNRQGFCMLHNEDFVYGIIYLLAKMEAKWFIPTC